MVLQVTDCIVNVLVKWYGVSMTSTYSMLNDCCMHACCSDVSDM